MWHPNSYFREFYKLLFYTVIRDVFKAMKTQTEKGPLVKVTETSGGYHEGMKFFLIWVVWRFQI